MNTIVFFILAAAFVAVASAQYLGFPALGRTSIVGPSGVITRDEGLGVGLAAPLAYGHGLATPFLGRSIYGHGGLLY